jgi:UDP-glucose 4-epimerase
MSSFAGQADIETSHKNPLDTIESNIMGNSIILDSCRRHNVKRFVFASTIYVYSNSGSFYRGSKQACEILIENFNQAYNLPYTILRYGSLYGPRSPKTNWIHKIIRQALSKKKITRHGDGEEMREYIHVKDAAELSVKILSKEYENKNVMITGNQPMRIKDLHIMVNEILGGKVKLEYLPSNLSTHYEITPYNYSPKVAKKLVSTEFYDMGQGILELVSEINKELEENNCKVMLE